ncbi:hypothetical protein OHB14_50155 [Streptomyces sp. NBC_01613]
MPEEVASAMVADLREVGARAHAEANQQGLRSLDHHKILDRAELPDR